MSPLVKDDAFAFLIGQVEFLHVIFCHDSKDNEIVYVSFAKVIPKLGMRIPILRVSVPRLGTSVPSAKIWVIHNTSNLFN